MCSKGVFQGKHKVLPLLQFLTITEISETFFSSCNFLVSWKYNKIFFAMIFNYRILDLASKLKSKKAKVVCLEKSPELLNFPFHFNLLQKQTRKSIIRSFSRIFLYLRIFILTNIYLFFHSPLLMVQSICHIQSSWCLLHS